MARRQFLPGVLIGALGGVTISLCSAGSHNYEATIGDALDPMLFVGLPIGAFFGAGICGLGYETAKDERVGIR